MRKGRVLEIEFLLLTIYYKIRLRVAKKNMQSYLTTSREDREHQPSPEDIRYIKRLHRLANKYKNNPYWRPGCYSMALAIRQLLNAYKIPSRIHIGFRIEHKEYKGHAWLSYKNRIICGQIPELDFYQELKPLAS